MNRRLLCLIVVLFFIQVPIISGNGNRQDSWKEYKSRHFEIYYKKAPDDFIRTVAESAEQYYQDITRNLGFFRTESWAWDRRAKIYIYDDRDQYVEKARQAHWSHGAAQAIDKVIRTFPTDHGFFDSTLPHELGHIIFREFVGYRSNIPLWMDEGVAMFQEKAKRWGANSFVREALKDGSFIPIPELTQIRRIDNSTPREKINLFYAEAASIVYFLVTDQGRYRFVNFCKQLKKGMRFDYALHEAYRRFENLDDLNEAWVNFLMRKR